LLTACVKAVEVLAALVVAFESMPQAREEVMVVLAALAEECSRGDPSKVTPCWTGARRAYFSALVAQSKHAEVAQHFAATLELFSERRPIPEWNSLVVDSLLIVDGLPAVAFELCCKSALGLVCNLIEVESQLVRRQLIGVLRRKLAGSE
jgi:hypothetical protein